MGDIRRVRRREVVTEPDRKAETAVGENEIEKEEKRSK